MSRHLAACAVLALLTFPAAAAVSEPGGLTPRLRAAANEVADFMLSASGAHVYECRAVQGGHGWIFLNPDATLFEGTRSVATHSTPGVWESSTDRSSTSGRVAATQPAGSGNLPWALYRTVPNAGSGIFAGVTAVQRVNTAGGVAPTGGCSATSLGSEMRVDFTADFYFYKRR